MKKALIYMFTLFFTLFGSFSAFGGLMDRCYPLAVVTSMAVLYIGFICMLHQIAE